ncbi:AraC family transcriptional regulator [Clostridium sediminicola]|uniref:AraC family transcriptional regulator n=1 Tax=Clostridium sediminicola TaxID=3114879 RepID=UPI0031F26D59
MLEKKLRIDSEKRELPVHIHQGFPIGIITSRFTEDTYDFVNWHWHQEIQYNVVLKGTFCFNVAGKEFTIGKGDGIFINTQHIHMAEAKEPDSSYLFVYFHPSLLTNQKDSYLYKTYISSLLTDDSASSILLHQEVDNDKKVIDIILKVKSIYDEKNNGYELDILSSLIQLWKHTISCANEKCLITARNDLLTNDRLKKIFSYINENYPTQFTLEDISEHINLSRSHCCRFFKNSVGQNLFQYIINFRVNKSIELLINTNKSIADIAYEVGFNSQSYFTKCFTAIKNKTPNNIRNEIKNKKLEKEYLINIGND